MTGRSGRSFDNNTKSCKRRLITFEPTPSFANLSVSSRVGDSGRSAGPGRRAEGPARACALRRSALQCAGARDPTSSQGRNCAPWWSRVRPSVYPPPHHTHKGESMDPQPTRSPTSRSKRFSLSRTRMHDDGSASRGSTSSPSQSHRKLVSASSTANMSNTPARRASVTMSPEELCKLQVGPSKNIETEILSPSTTIDDSWPIYLIHPHKFFRNAWDVSVVCVSN